MSTENHCVNLVIKTRILWEGDPPKNIGSEVVEVLKCEHCDGEYILSQHKENAPGYSKK